MRHLGGCMHLLAIIIILSFTEGQKDVHMPPYIIKGPRDSAIVRREDSVTLECKGGGKPDVTYEWKKNGLDLNRNLPNIKSGTDGTVTIETVTSIDEGYYQCFVRNRYGTALSNIAHIQKARIASVLGTPSVNTKTVKEGRPFVIEAQTGESFPKPTYGWELAKSIADKKPLPFNPSSRIQVDDNGNLHFAYAKPEDDLSDRIYKSTNYNQYLDVKSGGSYTKVVVVKANESQVFSPVLGFSSEPHTVGIIGESVVLRCFFYGNPEPAISWKGPGNRLPLNRWMLDRFNSELTVSNVTASDQGNYTCVSSNARGQNSHTLQLRVEAKPSFRNSSLGPRNINVTDGEDATFECNADGIPEAEIVWLQNGDVLDVKFPPKKFSFSSDRKILTIRSVCLNCDDPGRQTDLMVIQCNASNVHGYVFGSGYLNILAKTRIIPDKMIEVSVELDEEKRFDFDCNAVSDPSTPPRVRWHRVADDGKEELVYNEPPAITLNPKDGEQSVTLSIVVSPNETEKWMKYRGEYRCYADNGYSTATKVVNLKVKNYDPPETQDNEDSFKPWMKVVIIVAATLITSFILFFILPRYYFKYAQQRQTVERDANKGHRRRASTPKPSLASNYERLPYDSLYAFRLTSQHVNDDSTQPNSTPDNYSETQDANRPNQFICSKTVDNAYDQSLRPAETTSSLATRSDRHGNQVQEENAYCDLTGRDTSYLPLYSELRPDNTKDANMM